MKLLTMHSLTEDGRLSPEAVELNLSERDSSAVLTLGPDAPALAVGRWIQDTDDPGAGIVWRVRTVEDQYDSATVRATLEHMIRSLADFIIPNEVKSKDISGSGTCSARDAIEYVLGLQTDWILGDFDYDSEENPYAFSGDTLLAAVETVSASLEDPVWSYDFSVYPFRLNITKKSTTPACELRAGRNIATLRKQVDKSRMYTRLYPVGFKNLKLSPLQYVSRNENLWGVIEKTETDQGQKTDAELRAWATARLSRHCTPLVTVTVSGLDLSRETGEPMDRLTVGRTCRIPLPEYGVTMLETITRLAWRDKLKDPEGVTVTLANDPTDVQTILAQQSSSGGRSARMSAEADEDNSLIIGSVESGLYTRIAQTASELRREAHNEAEGLRTFVIQTASEILQLAENDKESLRSLVVQTASEIRGEVENEADSIRSLVSQTASTWNAKIEAVTDSTGRVTAASIGIAINQSGSNAYIDADHVKITGDTTLSGTMEIDNGLLWVKRSMTIGSSGGDTVAINNGKVTGSVDIRNSGALTFVAHEQSGTPYYQITSAVVGGMIKTASLNATTNVLTLIKFNGEEINFSKATTTRFSGSWNGAGVYSVTADPNGVTSLTVEPGLRLNGTGYSSSFSAQMGSDQFFTSVEKSSMGYLHQNGGYVGVYTNYSSGTYSGLIAQLPVADTSNADVVSVTGVSVSYNAAKKVNVTFTEDIGVKNPGGIDEVWASGRTATHVVNLDDVLEPVYQASISSTAQQIRPSSALGRVGLLGVNIPAVKLEAKTVTATSSGQTFSASDYSLNGFSSLTVNYASTYAHNMTINRKQTNVQKGNYYDTRFYRRNADGTINTSAYIEVTAGHSVYTSATDVGSAGKTVYYN